MTQEEIARCLRTPGCPEWHEARRRGIGGSDWVDVLGIPPYGCARELWYEKTGTEPDYDPE